MLRISLSLALIAFAANSLICRAALAGDHIDAYSFTVVRLVSGALALLVLLQILEPKSKHSGSQPAPGRGRWTPWQQPYLASGFLLFAYAIGFSVAYLRLSTGTGAILLFGSVQITMLAAAILRRQSLSFCGWLGFVLAFLGLVVLVLPSIATPPPLPAIAMVLSGVAWGLSSLMGQLVAKEQPPVQRTTLNFCYALPWCVVISIFFYGNLHLSWMGFGLALLSGSVTSGMGYVLWYRCLPQIRTTQAAVLQLFVPILAAAAGVLFLGEAISVRLAIAAAMVLSGSYIAIRFKTAIAPRT